MVSVRTDCWAGLLPLLRRPSPRWRWVLSRAGGYDCFPRIPTCLSVPWFFPNAGLKQRLCLLKTLTRPTRLFTFLPCLSCLWVVVVYASCTFFSLVVDSAGKEVARKTHLLFSFIASEVSCSDYLLFVRLLGGYFCFLFFFDDNHHCLFL